MTIQSTLSTADTDSPPGILAERWPALGRAMGRYERSTAERFSRLAYDHIESGIIRQDHRQMLAAAAEQSGIRPFDAQLLIACALRQWVLDHDYDASPSPKAPRLSFEYQAWQKWCLRISLVIGTAVILDTIILWKWLG